MAKDVKAQEAPLPFFSVIIPTYNRTKDLLQTLNALEKQTYQSFEVVVCSAGEKDTFEKLKKFKSSFPIHNLYEKIPGRTTQRNAACKTARGYYFVFIDDHFIAHPNLLKNYSGLIHTCPDPVHFIRGGVHFTAAATPVKDSDVEFCQHYGYGDLQNPFKMSVTNNMCISRYAFEGIGGFDEDFKGYGYDDSHLGCRAQMAGFRFHYLPKALGAIFNASSAVNPDNYQKHIEVGRAAYLLYLKNKKYGRRAGFHFFNRLIARYLQRAGKLESCIARIIKSQHIQTSDYFYLFMQGLLEGPQYFKKDRYRPWKKQMLSPSV